MELPPRARRIPLPGFFRGGLTRNYLRVRGEYLHGVDTHYSIMELPPRARRIQPVQHGDDVMLGTTSACAENTICLLMLASSTRNYLRVRGEYLENMQLKGY